MNEQSARLINANEFQEKILNYALSDKLDKMIENTIFSNDQKCRSAIIQGMIIASMITSECNSIYIDVDSMIPIENFENQSEMKLLMNLQNVFLQQQLQLEKITLNTYKILLKRL